MKNTFLVTGATGFIGANIVRELVKLGQHTSIIVRNRKLNWRLHDISNKIDIYECDIQDEKLLEIVNRIKPDYIFHLARYGNLSNEDDINKMIDINFKGTINLINAVKQNPFKLLINTSSCIEYGVKEQSMKETDYLVPINNFGVITAGITLYAQKEAIRNNLPIITLRLFTPYGYYEDGFRLIPSVIKSAIGNEPIKVSAPENVRDFIFIEDVVSAYMGATEIRHNPGEIYNIGSGKQHSVGEIVQMIQKITKNKSDVEWGAVAKQARYIEPSRWEADITKAKKTLNWEPKFSIESGLIKTIEWFKKNKNLYLTSY
ncbi:MAG: SDR family NAD(P)-dependent oxidoreductase [Candidatus Parcubacteria bacterium]|nr:SDR family NAD(P)-dependent oxidoreductase [Candidatus Parcubacteria bacterium]